VIRTQVTIINKLGLHARAAAKFVACTASFSSRIHTGNGGDLVDGKSIMSVMMLAAGQGTTLDLEIEGPDEQEALKALQNLIDDYFEEGE
jgi:phosphocarrier protein|tara:strand:+ start:24159 stop:24428 length:270 start_codon:yes stop_codon:yes gene_type:complete